MTIDARAYQLERCVPVNIPIAFDGLRLIGRTNTAAAMKDPHPALRADLPLSGPFRGRWSKRPALAVRPELQRRGSLFPPPERVRDRVGVMRKLARIDDDEVIKSTSCE
jgi:hypothetical protein